MNAVVLCIPLQLYVYILYIKRCFIHTYLITLHWTYVQPTYAPTGTLMVMIMMMMMMMITL